MAYFRIAAAILTLALAGCVSGYQRFYQPAPGVDPAAVAARRFGPPPQSPLVERAQPGNGQEIVNAYARRGYLMIGYSSFNSGRAEPEQNAIQEAQAVGADLVLILNPKYTGTVTTSVPITTPTATTSYSTGTATAYGRGGPVTAYGSGTTTTYGTNTTYVPMSVNRMDYGAIYFVRQKFGLGVFVRELNDAEKQQLQTNKGVVVRAVVDGTPAYDADILVGDVITAVNGAAVTNTHGFGDLVLGHAGQSITLSLSRQGKSLEKTVVLK